jgi:5-(carboxyamino)imidazole ribonucleotide synthase
MSASVLTGAGPKRSATTSGRAPVVGVVGAGQLARMTQQAAISLGVELHVLSASADDPAVRAGARHVPGSATEFADLVTLAAGCDVVTFDHELVPAKYIQELEALGVRVAPSGAAQRLAQDKLHARRTLAAAGFPVPAFGYARELAQVLSFAETHGWPLIAKTPTGGYDGRGVWTLADAASAARLLDDVDGGLLLEPQLRIDHELAVLVARTAEGETAVYPVVETVQRDAMCRELLAPAPIAPARAAAARSLARSLAHHCGAVGIVAVELFDTADGLLVNELALRPHNSGHLTIEGCETSQFEQHLRAILGWPLGGTALTAPAVATGNVIGPADGSDPRDRLAAALEVPGAHVHLYGKAPRPGRKLGHVTVCGPDPERCRRTAQFAVAVLEGAAR